MIAALLFIIRTRFSRFNGIFRVVFSITLALVMFINVCASIVIAQVSTPATLATSRDGTTALIARDGSFFVHILAGSTLISQDEINPPGNYFMFGQAASFSDDGNILLIADYLADDAVNNAGSVYVYTRAGDTWSFITTITASDATSDDQFGISVAVSGDGNIAIIGANSADTVSLEKAGAAYVFSRSGDVWTQQAKLVASDAAEGDHFGNSVTLDTDGNTAIVTAPGVDNDFNNTGAAYVFTRSSEVWTQSDILYADDRASFDALGTNATLSSDGNTALVSASGVDAGSVQNAGAGYVFVFSGETWSQQSKLVVTGAEHGSEYGAGFALSADGNTVALGGFTGFNADAMYVFTRSGETWSTAGTATLPDGYPNLFSGNSLSGGTSYFMAGSTINETAPTCAFDQTNFGECSAS